MLNNLTVEQKAAYFDQLLSNGSADLSRLLPDFSKTLETVIETRLASLGEPVFTNPTTGKTASSFVLAAHSRPRCERRANWTKAPYRFH